MICSPKSPQADHKWDLAQKVPGRRASLEFPCGKFFGGNYICNFLAENFLGKITFGISFPELFGANSVCDRLKTGFLRLVTDVKARKKNRRRLSYLGSAAFGRQDGIPQRASLPAYISLIASGRKKRTSLPSAMAPRMKADEISMSGACTRRTVLHPAGMTASYPGRG